MYIYIIMHFLKNIYDISVPGIVLHFECLSVQNFNSHIQPSVPSVHPFWLFLAGFLAHVDWPHSIPILRCFIRGTK